MEEENYHRFLVTNFQEDIEKSSQIIGGARMIAGSR